VASRSSEVNFTKNYTLLYFTLLYLVNCTRQCYSYYGTLIGTPTRSIEEWCHFQWLGWPI